MLVKKKLGGYMRPSMDRQVMLQYPPQMQPDQRYYDDQYRQYEEYDPYLDHVNQPYDMYAGEGVKLEHMHPLHAHQMMGPMDGYGPPPMYHADMHLMDIQAEQEYMRTEGEQESKEADEYDPLQNY
mmetsp:Transcript_14695/g.16995  ORF Transcript_14695/g.16995 Transcript_14695/m.16995 type:complete len:126 (+) Transcript_14695:1439-1816(+)